MCSLCYSIPQVEIRCVRVQIHSSLGFFLCFLLCPFMQLTWESLNSEVLRGRAAIFNHFPLAQLPPSEWFWLPMERVCLLPWMVGRDIPPSMVYIYMPVSRAFPLCGRSRAWLCLSGMIAWGPLSCGWMRSWACWHSLVNLCQQLAKCSISSPQTKGRHGCFLQGGWGALSEALGMRLSHSADGDAGPALRAWACSAKVERGFRQGE